MLTADQLRKQNTGAYYCLEERRVVETRSKARRGTLFAERIEDKVYAESFRLNFQTLSSLDSLAPKEGE